MPARAALSDRQAAVLKFFQECSATAPPTVREVMQFLGLRNPRGAAGHLTALVRKGYLTHRPRTSRGYRLRLDSAVEPALSAPGQEGDAPRSANKEVRPAESRIPIRGRVPAGTPSLQEEEDLGHIALPISVSERAFAVSVYGDSMRDAHIIDGDLVVVDPAVIPTDRATVLAIIDGNYTIKTLRKNAQGEWWLEPANDQVRPIVPRVDGDRADATVVALVRLRLGKRQRKNVE